MVDTISYATDPAQEASRLLSKQALEHFLTFVAKWGRAQALSLQGNMFEDEKCVRTLAVSLCSGPPNILSLNLSLTFLGDSAAVKLIKTLFPRNHNSAIRHLNLSACALTKTGACEIAVLLSMKHTSNVSNIDVRYNNIGFAGLAALVKGKFQRIDASFTNLQLDDEAGIASLVKALKHNSTLQTLILKGNQLSCDVLKKLKAAGLLASKLNQRTFEPMSLHVLEETPALRQWLADDLLREKHGEAPTQTISADVLDDIALLETPLVAVRSSKKIVEGDHSGSSPHRAGGEAVTASVDGSPLRALKEYGEEIPKYPDPLIVRQRAAVAHIVVVSDSRTVQPLSRSASVGSRQSAQERALFPWRAPIVSRSETELTQEVKDNQQFARITGTTYSPTKRGPRLIDARETTSVQSKPQVRRSASATQDPSDVSMIYGSRASSVARTDIMRRSASNASARHSQRAQSVQSKRPTSTTSRQYSSAALSKAKEEYAKGRGMTPGTREVEKGKILQKILNLCAADDDQCQQLLDLPSIQLLRADTDFPGLRVAMPETLRGHSAVPSELLLKDLKSVERVFGIAKLLWVVTYSGSTHIPSSSLQGKTGVPRHLTKQGPQCITKYESARNVENAKALRIVHELRPIPPVPSPKHFTKPPAQSVLPTQSRTRSANPPRSTVVVKATYTAIQRKNGPPPPPHL